MLKVLSFIGDIAIMGYSFYIAFFKSEVTMRDLAFMGFFILTNVMINQNRLERLSER